MGSTRAITDAAGNKVAGYKFRPYGEKYSSSGAFTTEYQFTGKPGIDEVGLSYFGGRWYDPEIGRFITQDPAKDGENWYAYCFNNPINYIDPTGLITYKFDVGGPADYEQDFTDSTLSTNGNGTITSTTTYKKAQRNTSSETITTRYNTETGEIKKEIRTYRDKKDNIMRQITYTWHRRTKTEATAINSTCKAVGGVITFLVVPPAVPWYVGVGAAIGSNFIPYDISNEGEVYVTASYYVSWAQWFYERVHGY